MNAATALGSWRNVCAWLRRGQIHHLGRRKQEFVQLMHLVGGQMHSERAHGEIYAPTITEALLRKLEVYFLASDASTPP